MKATLLLEKQHRIVKAIFRKLESGRTSPTPLLKELANNLAAHMAIEQDIFYPAIKEIDDDLVLESFEEHSLAEIALKRLLGTDPKGKAFQAHVTATKELIEHHVKEEEEELFPKVERALGRATLALLGERMEERFEQVVRAGFDATVPRGYAVTSADLSQRPRRTKARAA